MIGNDWDAFCTTTYLYQIIYTGLDGAISFFWSFRGLLSDLNYLLCKRVVEVDGRYTVDPAFGGPEYETIISMGPLCSIDDLEVIAKANELCNRYGIDTISTGSTIAFAMECYEKGLITRSDTGGLDLTWGNGDALIRLVGMIARREGIGEILSLGTRSAAKHWHAEEFALHVKGLEVAMHEPRWKKGLSLLYAVASRGGTHMDAPADDWLLDESAIIPEIGLDTSLEDRDPHTSNRGKVQTCVAAQNLYALYDCLVVCKYAVYPLGFSFKTLKEIFHTVTGWNASAEELISAARRGIELTRIYLAREGITREQDKLPLRLHEGLPSGPSKGDCVTSEELERMKNDYYSMRGWDQANGWPTKETLRKLGIEWSAEHLPATIG